MKNIPLDWLMHLPPERKEDFEKTLRNNSLLFSRLNAIIEEWERQLNVSETTKDQYLSPTWSHLQAHKNGNREQLKKLKDLISFAI